MAKLKYLNSVSQWKHKQISQYPEIKVFIEKLEKMIEEKPEKGLKDTMLSKKGILPYYRQSVNISLFSQRHAIGYSFITAFYIYNQIDTAIIKMSYY